MCHKALSRNVISVCETSVIRIKIMISATHSSVFELYHRSRTHSYSFITTSIIVNKFCTDSSTKRFETKVYLFFW